MGGSDGCRNDTLLIVMDMIYIWRTTIVGLRAHMSTYRGTLGLQTGPRWWEPLDQQTGPRCMWTTIRSSVSSPSASVNNPRLAYIWMYVCWGAHLDTCRDIWVRRVIITIDVSYVSCYSFCYVYLRWFLLYFTVMTPVTRVMDPWSLLFCIPVTIIRIATLIIYAWIFGGMRQKVYIWGFPCLDYSFDVLVSWDRDLSVYNHFCTQPVLLGFPVPWWLYHTCLHILHLCSNPYSCLLATWL